jgi:clostripain
MLLFFFFVSIAFTGGHCYGLANQGNAPPGLKESVRSLGEIAYVNRLTQVDSAGVMETGGDGAYWTFMVYLDADNNLEEDAVGIFLNLSSVGSTSQVNIVVQMDRIPGYDSRYGDWTDCRRFNVTKDLAPTAENAIESLGEVNMGDPNTLKDFVNWTANSFPASHYCLVLSDHGSGSVGSVCLDETSGNDWLTLPELSQALGAVPLKMDVLFFDACFMGMTEVAYQIRDYADIMVASEEAVWPGHPYNEYLSSLAANPSMSAIEFAEVIVSNYTDYTETKSYSSILPYRSTMSGTNLGQITDLKTAIDNFARKLNESESTYNDEMRRARRQAEGYEGPYSGMYGWYMDLYHFSQLVLEYIPDPEIRTDAAQVMTLISGIVVVEDNYYHPNSHGLSIVFPCKTDSHYNDFMNEYLTANFAKETMWDEFVSYHVSITPVKRDFAVLDVYWKPANPMPGDKVTFCADLANQGTRDESSVSVRAYKDGYLYASGISSFPAGALKTIFVTSQWTATKGNHSIRWVMDESNTFPDEWNETNNEMTEYFIIGYELKVQTPYNHITVKIDGYYYYTGTDGIVQTYVDAGSHAVEVQSLISLGTGSRALFTQWSDGNSSNPRTFFIDSNSTLIAQYTTQYYLTVKKNPSYVGEVTGEGWYESGSLAMVTCTSPVPSGTSTRYVLVNWTGDSSGTSTAMQLFMDGPKTVTANYKTQYNVTFQQSGSGGFPNVVVDDVSYPLPCSFWLDYNSSHTFSYESPVGGDLGVQYVVTSTSYSSPVTVSWSITVYGYYKTQFFINVTSSCGAFTPSQWVDKGSSLTVSVESPTETITNQTRWRCTSFSIDHSAPQQGTSHGFYYVQAPHEIEFYWVRQFWLQVDTGVNGSTVRGAGWYDNGTAASISAETPYTVSPTQRFIFISWVSTGPNSAALANSTSSGTTVTMNDYCAVQANWKVQFYLTVKTDPTFLSPQPNVSPPGPWYDNQTLVTCTARQVNGYAFNYWTIDGTGSNSSANPLAATVNGPHDITAHYIADSIKPFIDTPIHTPQTPNPNEAVEVSVNVTDSQSGLREVILSYSTNKGVTWVNATMSKLIGNTYIGEIPGFNAEAQVQYYVIAYDNANNAAVKDNVGEYYVYTAVPEFPTYIVLPLFAFLTVVAVALTRKKR